MNFFDNYTSKYIFLFIYCVIDIFNSINIEYDKYVESIYVDDNNTI